MNRDATDFDQAVAACLHLAASGHRLNARVAGAKHIERQGCAGGLQLHDHERSSSMRAHATATNFIAVHPPMSPTGGTDK